MYRLEEIRRRLFDIENELSDRPDMSWSSLTNLVETIVRAIVSECFNLINDRNRIASLKKVEDEIGGNSRNHHNFSLSELNRMWRQGRVPQLWQSVHGRTPSIFMAFPFEEFIEARNRGTHHARVPPQHTIRRLYYSAVELLNEAFPEYDESTSLSKVHDIENQDRHNLPRLEQDFVGRESELRQILEWLSLDSRAWLISLTGVGGVGKSALAIEAARCCLGLSAHPADIDPSSIKFDACVWTSAKRKQLVEGRVHDRVAVASNLDSISGEILRVAENPRGVHESPSIQQVERARRVLRSKRVLLIVDNMETIDDNQVLGFLSELPSPSKAIVTDRRAVQASSAIQLTEMPSDQAGRLLRKQLVNRGMSLSEDQIERLVKRTGGIPLAMMWAIGLMAQTDVGPEAVYRRLADSESWPLLDYMFKESFARATEPAKAVLAACCLPGSPVRGRQLAEWAALGLTDTEDALGELRRAALLRPSRSDGSQGTLDRWYEVLPLTRDFLRHQEGIYVAPEQRKHVARKIVDALMAEESNPDWPSLATINAVEEQRALIIWAIEDSFERQDDETVFRGMLIAGYPLGIRGYHLQRLQLAELALKAAKRSSNYLMIARCLVLNIAWVRFNWYEFDESQIACEKGLEAAQKIDDKTLQASSLRLLGLIAKERAERMSKDNGEERSRLQGQAHRQLLQALSIARVAGDRHLEAITLGALGSLFRDLGELAQAEVYLQDALRLARNCPHGEEIHTVMLQKISRLLSRQEQRLEEAESYNREAMTILQRLKRPVGVAHCKLNLALMEEQRGLYASALAYAEEAAEIFSRVGSKEDVRQVIIRLRSKEPNL